MKKHAQRKRVVPSTIRALIPLDTETIRKRELNKFKRSKKTCATLKAQAEQFEKKETPAFVQWLHAQCRSTITQINTLQGEIGPLQNTLYLAEELSDFYPNRTIKECADAAVHYIETSGKIPEGFELFFEEALSSEENEGDPFDSFDQEDPDDEEAEAARRFFDSLMDDLDDECTSDFSNPSASPAETEKEETSIKKLYRKIIRKLHPDRTGSFTPEQQELWHATRNAYEMRDLETLQHIEANCDLLDDQLIRFASVSSIQSGVTFYKRTNTQIRRTLRQMKQQPEWGFLTWSDKKKKKVLEKYTENLNDDLFMLSLNHSSMQRRLDRLRKAPREKVKKPTPRNRNQDLFEFF